MHIRLRVMTLAFESLRSQMAFVLGFAMCIYLLAVCRMHGDEWLHRSLPGAQSLSRSASNGDRCVAAPIEDGSIIGPYSVDSDSARLAWPVVMNYRRSLGYDAATGDFRVMSPYATLEGGARINADVFLGPHGSIACGKPMGASATFIAHSACLSDVPPDVIVFGVSFQAIKRIATASRPSDDRGAPQNT